MAASASCGRRTASSSSDQRAPAAAISAYGCAQLLTGPSSPSAPRKRQPFSTRSVTATCTRASPLVFDHADYDAEGDVLYLHVGVPAAAEGEETPEGHLVRFAPGTQRVVGLTIVNARAVLDRDGRLIVTVPETVEASADELAPALAAA